MLYGAFGEVVSVVYMTRLAILVLSPGSGVVQTYSVRFASLTAHSALAHMMHTRSLTHYNARTASLSHE